MTSPDFRTFVGTLGPGHSAWLAANPTSTGTEFFDHYVGDALHPKGLLWQYEQWRTEHRGDLVDRLTIEVFAPHGGVQLCRYRRTLTGEPQSWPGEYRPSDEPRDPENVGDWQVWYRIEEL